MISGVIAGIDEGRPQEQIFGGVAADRQLGRDQKACAAGVRGARRLDDPARIAGNVSDRRIELRDRDRVSKS